MKRLHPFFLPLICLVLFGCAEADVGFDEEGVFSDKLLKGELTSIRPEIGRLSLNGSSCTGTLIRPQVVISAAHCVGYRTNARDWGSFLINVGGQTHRYPIDGVFSYGNRLGRSDITLIHLKTPVSNQVAVPTQIAPKAPTSGNVTIFGYGCSNRRTGSGSGSKQLYMHPVSETSDQLCPGDSGGPVVIGTDGFVFKINSGYYTNGGGDIFGEPSAYYRELSAYANVMNIGGLSRLQAFIREGGVEQEGGEGYIGDQGQRDEEPPEVNLLSPENLSDHPENSEIEILAFASDDTGLASVALVWDFNQITYPCPTQQQYVSCAKEANGLWRWTVRVSQGERRFRIKATDYSGKETVTPSRTLNLLGSETASPPLPELEEIDDHDISGDQSAGPSINIVSPQNGQQHASETSLEIIAEIQSDVGLSGVELVWNYNQERYPCPTRQQYVDCDIENNAYHWTVRVTAPGERGFYIQATDQNGQRAESDLYRVFAASIQDQESPQVEIITPNVNETHYVDSEIEISAQITDDIAVTQVYLEWDFNGNHYPCPYRSQYVDCRVEGDMYRWSVRVNQGDRSFRVRALDGAGHQSYSEDRSFSLSTQ